MKTIKIPEPIEVKNLTTNEPMKVQNGKGLVDMTMDFQMFAMNILSDQKFSKDWKAIQAATKIWQAIDGAEPGAEVYIEDADFDMFRESVEKPANGYGNTMVAMQQAPFIVAVLNAYNSAEEAKE